MKMHRQDGRHDEKEWCKMGQRVACSNSDEGMMAKARMPVAWIRPVDPKALEGSSQNRWAANCPAGMGWRWSAPASLSGLRENKNDPHFILPRKTPARRPP